MKLRKGLLFVGILVLNLLTTSCKEEKKPYQTPGLVEAKLFYVSSPRGGVLHRLYVEEGESVKKGQWICKIKNQQFIESPKAGQVMETFYQPKEYVPPGSPILSLFFPSQMYILFYIPEKHLNRIEKGKNVTIRFNQQTYPAKVTYISPQTEYTPDSLFQEKHKNKSVFKVKADISDDLRKKVHLGQSVDVDYE